MLLKKMKAYAGEVRQSITNVAATECRWLASRSWRRAPSADSRVIVSLTSHPPRFPFVARTLKTLLMQSYRDYRLMLWIAEADYKALPRRVHELTEAGLEVMICRDLRAFNKLLPAMQRFPGHMIVTADDDVCYWPTWLEELVSQYTPGNNEVLCHRMHEILLNPDGTPRRYSEWRFESPSLVAHRLNFATGVGGVLYPPKVFAAEAFEEEKILLRCPTADDVWFYWMARRNGALVRKVASTGVLNDWRGSQSTGLSHVNVAGGQNDRIIQNMLAAYGFPA